MVLRNVQPTFTFEEQRVEINELAADVDSINAGYNNTDWDTAFSWGNHATQNYIVNGTFSNVTINAGITTRNLTITDDGSASPIFISRADDQSVWNLSLQNDGYSTNAATGTKFFMSADGTAKWYHYGYSTFENTEFYTARVTGSPTSYLAFRLDTAGGAQLLYQGNYRAGSTSWGLNVTGNLYASQGMDIPDGYAFHAGNSDDLRLGHTGTYSYIDNYTGALNITNTANDEDITLATDSGSGGVATYIRCDGSNGEVQLAHYGNTKLRTTSTGVDITGNLVADGLTLYDDEKLLFGNNTDLEIFHDQTNNIIQSDTGNLEINSGNSAGNVEINVNNNVAGGTKQSSAKFIKGGAVELYHADTLKFETTATGVEVSGTVVSDPTATNVAGYGFEVKNGATSLGGLYKTTSNGGFLQLNNGSGTLKASINGEDGSAQFGEASGNVVSINTDGKLTARNSSSSATIVLATNFNGTDNFTVAANGAVTSASSIAAASGAFSVSSSGALSINRTAGTNDILSGQLSGTATTTIKADGSASFASVAAKSGFNLTNETTAARVQLSSDISGNYTGWKEKGVASGSMSQTSIDSKTPVLTDFAYPNASDGMLIWSTSKIGFAAGSESPQFGNGVQMLFDSNGLALGGIRAFDRTSAVNTTTDAKIKLLAASGDIAAAGTLTFTGQTNSATGTASSDALDHYEEGTWTPTPYYQNAGDASAASFTTANGYYTRIGNIVHVSAYVVCSGPSSPANDNVGINGLPYNNAANIAAVGNIYFNAGGPSDVVYYVNPGASLGSFLTISGTGNLGDELGTSWEATIQITYRVL